MWLLKWLEWGGVSCIIEGKDEHMIRKSDSLEGGLEDDNKAVLDDLGYNAELYITNQEVVHD